MKNPSRHICFCIATGVLSIVLSTHMFGQAVSTVGGSPGAAFRMGTSARGIALGNAMVAVRHGMLGGSENPAVVPDQSTLGGSVGFSLLSLDRRLNLLTFGQPLKPNAGISFQVINAGVANIDERNRDGVKTGSTSTSENAFILSFGLRPDDRLSIGVSTKVYYHVLYEDMKSTSVGFNAGLLYRIADDLTLGAAILDLNSRYRWDSKSLWGRSGTSVTERFPTRRIVGVSYLEPSTGILAATQIEWIAGTAIAKAGFEYPVHELVALRAGIDQVSFSNDFTPRPSFGFQLRQPLLTWTPSLEYAFVLEPYGVGAIHVVGLAVSIP